MVIRSVCWQVFPWVTIFWLLGRDSFHLVCPDMVVPSLATGHLLSVQLVMTAVIWAMLDLIAGLLEELPVVAGARVEEVPVLPPALHCEGEAEEEGEGEKEPGEEGGGGGEGGHLRDWGR